MHRGKSEKPIRLHYFCRDVESGEILEDTRGGEPDQLMPGAGDWPPPVEKAVLAMAPGETRTVQLPPDEGFGFPDESLIFEIPREMLQLDDAEPGDLVEICPDGEESRPGTLVELSETTAIVDANHPYAGRLLEFTLTRLA